MKSYLKFLFISTFFYSCENGVMNNHKNVSNVDTLNIDINFFFNYDKGESNLSNDYTIQNKKSNLYDLNISYYNKLKLMQNKIDIILAPTSKFIKIIKINNSKFYFSVNKSFNESRIYFDVYLKPKKGYIIFFTPSKEYFHFNDSLQGCQIGNIAPSIKYGAPPETTATAPIGIGTK